MFHFISFHFIFGENSDAGFLTSDASIQVFKYSVSQTQRFQLISVGSLNRPRSTHKTQNRNTIVSIDFYGGYLNMEFT